MWLLYSSMLFQNLTLHLIDPKLNVTCHIVHIVTLHLFYRYIISASLSQILHFLCVLTAWYLILFFSPSLLDSSSVGSASSDRQSDSRTAGESQCWWDGRHDPGPRHGGASGQAQRRRPAVAGIDADTDQAWVRPATSRRTLRGVWRQSLR